MKKKLNWIFYCCFMLFTVTCLFSFTESSEDGDDDDLAPKKYACVWDAPNTNTATVKCSGEGTACKKATECVK